MNLMKKLLLITLVGVFAFITTSVTASADSHMRTPIDYRKPSETIPYPDIDKGLRSASTKTGSTSCLAIRRYTQCTAAPESTKTRMVNG